MAVLPKLTGPSRDVEEAAEATLLASYALLGLTTQSLAGALEQVTLQQFRVLVLLSSNGPQPSGVLANGVGVKSSTFTRLADRLVRDSWVDRSQPVDNRRQVIITLTNKGRRLVNDAMTLRRDKIVEVLNKMSAADRTQVRESFQAFAEACGEQEFGPLVV